jgi:peptidyl-prolyl cis-trans isomerase SurA
MTYRKTLAAGALCAAMLLPAGLSRGADIIEQVLVKVNGEIFTKTELEARQVSALRQMGQQIDPNTDPTDAELRKMLDEVTPQLLVNVVDEMLLVQRGRQLGYTMGDDQFQSILASIKKDNNIETDEQFQQALKQENMTLADLRQSLERQMIRERVLQNEVMGKIAVNDEEARAYYQAHLDEFTSPQTVTLREIFVAIPGDPATATVADDTAARTKALDIRRRALAGESFEQLATSLSDAASKANAGLIGPLNTADLSADVQKLLDAMKPGDITDVLRGSRGYQILKLESVSAPEVRSFEEARTEISNRVFTDKRRGEFEKYLARVRSEAIIEWKNADLERAYNLGLEQAKNPPPADGSTPQPAASTPPERPAPAAPTPAPATP